MFTICSFEIKVNEIDLMRISFLQTLARYGLVWGTSFGLHRLFCPLALAETDTRSSAVLVDELDAGFQKNLFNCRKSLRITGVAADL